jgi:hypothetical protein
MRTPLPLTLITGAVAVFAAGCGGDDSKASGARGYDDTIAAVNEICTNATRDANAIGKDANGEADHDAPLVKKLVDSNQKYIDELKDIEPDAKLEAAFGAYVGAVESQQSKAREALTVAESGDSEAYRMAIETVNAENAGTKRLARALGATECTKD